MPEVIQRFLGYARNDKPLAMSGGRADHMVPVTAMPFTRAVGCAVPANFDRVNEFSTAPAIRAGRAIDLASPARTRLGRFGEPPLPAVSSAISLLSAEGQWTLQRLRTSTLRFC